MYLGELVRKATIQWPENWESTTPKPRVYTSCQRSNCYNELIRIFDKHFWYSGHISVSTERGTMIISTGGDERSWMTDGVFWAAIECCIARYCSIFESVDLGDQHNSFQWSCIPRSSETVLRHPESSLWSKVRKKR